MEIKEIYRRNSPQCERELEMIFKGGDLNYIMVFSRSDFFLVNIFTDFSLEGFFEFEGMQRLSNDVFPSIVQILQSDDFQTICVVFDNAAIMRIGFYFDNNYGDLIQGVEILTKKDKNHESILKEMERYNKLEVYDFRYSSDALPFYS